MPRALLIGGTGQIGTATAHRLLQHGWTVHLTGRDPANMPTDLTEAGATFTTAHRDNPSQLADALGDGADLLLDCLCYTTADAQLLLPLAANATSTVMISSKAVYVDDHGNHSNSPTPPRYTHPVRETQTTLAPRTDIPYNTRDGYGPNKVAAEHTLLDSDHPITILRPSRIHGIGAGRPREWHFVKRALDQRPAILLTNRGTGTVHPTAATNIAALIETAAHQPGQRILNSADPDAPTALDISRTITNHLGHTWDEILLDDTAPTHLGHHPWESTAPVILDTTAALQLGYQPVGDYATTVTPLVDWLSNKAQGGVGEKTLPGLNDPYFDTLFDYSAEDTYLAVRSTEQNPTR
ncbi:MAG TPA: NAD-dependent epimerase/dehydratase family protein [Pseudonocardiaceae bacterium]|nr:NAD-dependent epimerase/dehydratase family protein [Pseudonocardiaceae bacterium]